MTNPYTTFDNSSRDRTVRPSTVKLKTALRQIDPDDVNLFHGRLLLRGLVTPPPWHIAIPSGGGVHSNNIGSRLTIISMLRKAEVALAQGQSVGQACRTLGVSEQSYYRWRKEYGGLRTDQAKRLKDLEKENGRLRKAISDLTLDKLILKEALEGNC